MRVGPPYGAINLLLNPRFTSNYVEAGVTWAAAGDGWGIDRWAPGSAYPTAVASWTSVATAVPGDAAASFGVKYGHNQPTANSWQLFMGSPMIAGQIISATIPMPQWQDGGGAYIFEVYARASAPLGMGLEIVNNNETPVMATQIAGGTLSATWQRFAAIYQFASGYGRIQQGGSPPGRLNKWMVLNVYASSTAATGNFLQFSLCRFQALPTAGDFAGSWFDGTASAQTMASLLNPAAAIPISGSWLGAPFHSWSARQLFNPGLVGNYTNAAIAGLNPFDAQQPVGLAIEIGSMIVPESMDTGHTDLLTQTYTDGPSLEGGLKTYDDVHMRIWKMSVIAGFGASQQMQRDVTSLLSRAAAQPGNLLSFRPEGGSFTSHYNIQGGYFSNKYDIRYSRAGVLKGDLRIDTDPYARVYEHALNNLGFRVWGIPSNPNDLRGLMEGDAPPLLGASGINFGIGTYSTPLLTNSFPNGFFSLSPWPILISNQHGKLNLPSTTQVSTAGSYGYACYSPTVGLVQMLPGSWLSSAGLSSPTGFVAQLNFASGASLPSRFRVLVTMAHVAASSMTSLYGWAEFFQNLTGLSPTTRSVAGIRGPVVGIPPVPSAGGASTYHRMMLFDMGEFGLPTSARQPNTVGKGFAVRIGLNVASYANSNGSAALYVDSALIVPADGLLVVGVPTTLSEVTNGNTMAITSDVPAVLDVLGNDISGFTRGKIPLTPQPDINGLWGAAVPFAYWTQASLSPGPGPTGMIAIPDVTDVFGNLTLTPRWIFAR